jgi:hypothetical protein
LKTREYHTFRYFSNFNRNMPSIPIQGQDQDGDATDRPSIVEQDDEPILNGNTAIGIGWNDLTDEHWQQIAAVAGDRDWKVSKAIAWKNPPEAMTLMFTDGTLKEAFYIQPCRLNCGMGYKGCGLSYAEKKQIELFFNEVEDEGHPYTYARKPHQVNLSTIQGSVTTPSTEAQAFDSEDWCDEDSPNISISETEIQGTDSQTTKTQVAVYNLVSQSDGKRHKTVRCTHILTTDNVPTPDGRTALGIGWNEVTDNLWQEIAHIAGDSDWMVTKAIAEEKPPEWFTLMYHGKTLKEAIYMLPFQRSCGKGYKGCGMSYEQKKQVELFFDEIEDEGHPYAYARKSEATGFFYTPLSRANAEATSGTMEGCLSKTIGDAERGAAQTALIVRPKLVDVVDGEAEDVIMLDWNQLDKTVWKMCAENAGDINWRFTSTTAQKVALEGLKMVWRKGKLVEVRYLINATHGIRSGYKGFGMTAVEKAIIEENFVEINDSHPYTYVRKSAMDTKWQTSKEQTVVDYDKSIIQDLVDAFGRKLTTHKMSRMGISWQNNRIEVIDFTHRFLHKEQTTMDGKRKRDTTRQETKDQSESKMKAQKSDVKANNDMTDKDMPVEEQYMLGQTRLVTYDASTDSWR